MDRDYLKYFPFESPRDEQVEIIDKTLEALSKKKKYILIEAPTGVGKSAISVTLGRYLSAKNKGHRTNVVTTQKILQDQYVNDYGGSDLVSIKSKTNYMGNFYSDLNCGESLRLLFESQDPSKEHKKECAQKRCKYSVLKEQFIRSPIGVTNMSYFLYETTFAQQLSYCHLMIVDECHNIEKEIMSFVNTRISSIFVKEMTDLEIPNFLGKNQYVEWISGELLPELRKKLKFYRKSLASIRDKYDDESQKAFIDINKSKSRLESSIYSLEAFLTHWNPNNWSFTRENMSQGGVALEFKPIDVSHFTQEKLFDHAGSVIMMSATILDKIAFCKTLGISIDQCEFISTGSPFDKESRPIHFVPVGNMGKKFIKFTLPKMAVGINEILKVHPNEKGIIHTNSYSNARSIYNDLRNPRLLIHNSSNRDKVLEQHIHSEKPTVLLTPSMTEGVDLKYELSRFQVLCKIPYPYLMDPQIQLKMKKQPWWYNYQTAKTIIQALGRSVRTEDDHAVSYILDSSWAWFYKSNIQLFPPWFREAYHTG